MRSVSVADAKARFSELVQAAEAGETVSITRRGKPVARIVAEAPVRAPFDFDALASLTRSMTPQQQSAGDFIREMRDTDRY